jgi:hypothetical protein
MQERSFDENTDLPESQAEFEQEGLGLEPGLTSEPLETNPINVVDPDVRTDMAPAEPDPTYFPSTDPVIRANDQQVLEVIDEVDIATL